MGVQLYKQMDCISHAFVKKDHHLVQEAIEAATHIEICDQQVNQDVLHILALRQPVAFDLRTVIAALKISYQLKSIGYYMASLSRRFSSLMESGSLSMETPALLMKMIVFVLRMTEHVVPRFFSSNELLSKKSWEADNEIDRLYGALLRELLTYMMEDPRKISTCIHWLFISKNIERAGDHLKNITQIIDLMIVKHASSSL